jgi:hypothetical protein
VENFLIQLLEIVNIQIWYLLHDVHHNRRMHWTNYFVHLHAERNQWGLYIKILFSIFS